MSQLLYKERIVNLLTSTILAVCLAVGFTSCFDEKSNLSVATEGEGEEGESEGPVIVGEGEGDRALFVRAVRLCLSSARRGFLPRRKT